MRYLFFDIECCDGKHICEFGYVITDINSLQKKGGFNNKSRHTVQTYRAKGSRGFNFIFYRTRVQRQSVFYRIL